MLKLLKIKLYKCFFVSVRNGPAFTFYVCFRAELNRQKQRSQELELQLETDHNTIAEVCIAQIDICTHTAVGDMLS